MARFDFRFWPASTMLHATRLAGPWLNLRLLGDFKCIVDFNSKVANSALQLCVPKKELYSAKVFGPSVNQCCLCTTRAMRFISCRIQTD